MKLLVMNAGSSSQKSRLYELPDLPESPPEPIWKANIDWTRADGASLTVEGAGQVHHDTLKGLDKPTGIAKMLDTMWKGKTAVVSGPDEIDGVGHRVVHGGSDYRQSVRITDEVKAAIADLIPLAPSHNSANLEGIQAVEQRLGAAAPQVAVFDTAFHAEMPLPAQMYPVPYRWYKAGIRRYGFHGISHRYCAHKAAQLLGQDITGLKLITCHLGNGCSLAAVDGGRSVNTTMGFTPLEGLMMGTRSGSVDPGVLIHMVRSQNYTVEHLDHLLNKESGLKGVSEVSNDMRQIRQAIDQGNSQAQLALDLFIHRLQSEMGSMLMALGGLDALVFTGGVGEHSPEVRQRACDALSFLGCALDPDKNTHVTADGDVAAPEAKIRVLVVAAQEEWAIAQDCWHLMH
ncbi:MAG: acetate/propionate family kinase [Elainellaceae cyanobacterium]